MKDILASPQVVAAIITSFVAITIALLPNFLGGSTDSISNVSPSLPAKIDQIRASLTDFEILIQEFDGLSQAAIDAEQRALEAEALLSLSDEELTAIDNRLNRNDDGRQIFFLVLGAILGVTLDQAAQYIFSKFKNGRNGVEQIVSSES